MNRTYQYYLDSIEARVDELKLYVEKLKTENELLKVELDRSNTVLEIVRKSIDKQNPEWISVEDELPPAGKTILTFDRYEEIHMHFFGNSKAAKGEITHWMPLPEPPKPKAKKFRKKPVVVDAYQTEKQVVIHTLEGNMTANVGDYIITGVNGEKYPCKPDIFEKTYEPYFEEEGEADA